MKNSEFFSKITVAHPYLAFITCLKSVSLSDPPTSSFSIPIPELSTRRLIQLKILDRSSLDFLGAGSSEWARRVRHFSKFSEFSSKIRLSGTHSSPEIFKHFIFSSSTTNSFKIKIDARFFKKDFYLPFLLHWIK